MRSVFLPLILAPVLAFACGGDTEDAPTLGALDAGPTDASPGPGPDAAPPTDSPDASIAEAGADVPAVPVTTGLVWAKCFAAWGGGDDVHVAIDANHDVVLAGLFDGTASFGGDALVSAGGADAFVAKLDKDGNHLWSKRFGGPSDQLVEDVAVDANGAIVIGGLYYHTMDFGGGPLPDVGATLTWYFAKLDAAGNYVFASQPEPGVGSVSGVATGASGDVVVVGGRDTASYVGGFDPAGKLKWSSTFPNTSARLVAIDGDAHVVVGGILRGSTNFGGDDLFGGGGNDVFLAQFDKDGKHVWSKRYGDNSDQSPFALSLSPDGHVAVGGEFAGALDFGNTGGGRLSSSGQGDVFIARFDSSGNPLASRAFGNTDVDGDAPLFGGLAFAPNGELIFSGAFTGTIDFGGGAEVSTTSAAYVVELDKNDGYRWSKAFGDARNQIATDVAMDPSGEWVVAVDLGGPTDFGAGTIGAAHQICAAKFHP